MKCFETGKGESGEARMAEKIWGFGIGSPLVGSGRGQRQRAVGGDLLIWPDPEESHPEPSVLIKRPGWHIDSF